MKPVARIAAISLFTFLASLAPQRVAAQTIDMPAATVMLTKKEVYSVRQFKSDIAKLEAAIGKKLDDTQRRALLDAQINALLFKQYCEREKIFATDADVNKAFDQAKAQLGPTADDAAVEAAFRAQGSLTDAKSAIRQQLLMQNYIRTKKADALKALTPPTADDIMKAYDLMKSTLVRPDTVRVSVIYIDLTGKSAADRKSALTLLQGFASALSSNPSKFDEILLRSSDPSSGYKASSSSVVEKTPQAVASLGQAFVDAVFKLKQGEITALVQGENTYAIARANEILPQKQLTLTDPVPGQAKATVQDLIQYQLAMKKQQDFLKQVEDELVAQLRKDATVTIFEENLKF